MIELDDYDDAEMEKLERERAATLKAKLKNAKPGDFQIVKVDHYSGGITWAVSLQGCQDMAWFARKQDAERFVKSWAEKC